MYHMSPIILPTSTLYTAIILNGPNHLSFSIIVRRLTLVAPGVRHVEQIICSPDEHRN
jgi:hypothetical protein